MIIFDIFHNEQSTRDVAAGETIFAEGAHGDCMYAVLAGEIDIVRHGQVLETIGPGGLFGEMALLDGQPRSAAAIARTPARVASIAAQRFTQLVALNPYFALDMMRLLAERVRRNLSA